MPDSEHSSFAGHVLEQLHRARVAHEEKLVEWAQAWRSSDPDYGVRVTAPKLVFDQAGAARVESEVRIDPALGPGEIVLW